MSSAERSAYLTEQTEAAAQVARRTHRVSFREMPLDLTVVRVSIDFPRYRLENGRTRRMQEAYLNSNPEAPADLFADGASAAAQNAQHLILSEMAKQANLEELLTIEGQREPLVVTHDGYVINGNRRLAVLRSLGNTQFVDLVVLPEQADRRDLAMMEMNLQMAEDGKADYNWVDELLTIQHNVEILGISKKKVAQAMHAYEKTIALKLHTLELVNAYLSALGLDGQHFQVDGDEQAFDTLARAHIEIANPVKQANLRKLAFNRIKYPRPGSSVHRQIQALVKGLDKTIEIMGTPQTPSTAAAAPSNTSSHGPSVGVAAAGLSNTRQPQGGLTGGAQTELAWLANAGETSATAVSQLMGSGQDGQSSAELLSQLEEPELTVLIIDIPIDAETAEAVHEAVDVACGVQQEETEAKRALNAVMEVASRLHAVKVNSETSGVETILAQLKAIEERCATIRSDIERIRGN